MSNFFLQDFKPSISLKEIKERPIEAGILYLKELLASLGVKDDVKIAEAIHYFTPRIYRKDSYFLTAGTVSDKIGFIIHGAMKVFYKEDTDTRVLLLLTEEDFPTDLRSFFHKQPTKLNYLFTEDSILLEINHADFMLFIGENKEFAEAFIKVISNVVTSINMHNLLLKLPAKNRYESMLKEKPQIFNRFLLQDIASFMGIKQETLSRARSQYKKK